MGDHVDYTPLEFSLQITATAEPIAIASTFHPVPGIESASRKAGDSLW
jgi:hypothetical protein